MATLSSVLAQIRQNESGGNYIAQNPSSSASGAYQFINGTWQSLTQQSGIGTQYSTAAAAPPNVQDAVAAYALEQNPNANSSSLWGGGSSSYPLVTSYDVSSQQLASGQSLGGFGSTIGQGPADTGLGGSTVFGGGTGTQSDPYTFSMDVTPTPTPSTSGGTTAAGTAGNVAGSLGADVGFAPGIYGGPQAQGLAPGVVNSITGWINSIEGAVGTTFKNAWDATVGQVENLALRFMIVLAAIGVIIVALWRLLDPDGSKVTAVLKTAAAA